MAIPLSALATIIPVVVPGIADIYLAGQPSGSTLGGDAAPVNSPVLVSGLSLVAGNSLTFSVTGFTGGAGCNSTTPDGCAGSFSTGTANGLSMFTGPPQALIGVFVTNGVPSGVSPPGISPGTSFASLSPGLNVVFFIGDGLTGTGSGSTQTFVIPVGATRFFLGSSDGIGGNFNNFGTYSVAVNDGSAPPPPPPPGVPEPETLALLAVGLVALAARRAKKIN